MSTFYNLYDDVRSAEPGPPPSGLPITFGNGVGGHTYGVEVATVYQVTDHWRLRAGYTFLKKDLAVQPGSNDLNKATAESDDPEHEVVIQSSADLPGRVEWDVVARYVDALPNPYVPAYVGLDARLGWKLIPRLQVSVVGQNLLDSARREFTPASPAPRQIQRGVYAMLTWR